MGLLLGFSLANAKSFDRLWAGQVDVIDSVAGTMVPCKVRIELSEGNYTLPSTAGKVLDIQTCVADKTYPRSLFILENGDVYDQFTRKVVGQLDDNHFFISDSCGKFEIIDMGLSSSKIFKQELCGNTSVKEINGYLTRVW